MKEFTAWAIDTQSTEYIEKPGLLGRYFFNRPIPPHMEGCTAALFKTRAIAREYLKKNFAQYTPSTWKPKVIKVKVTIEEN
ncbi:hypothetical protein LCGC14_3165670 [marine sediment metagenome]|uniref:Uncharacterized protein n=1 Tax=marine sediment metagenome TaxID=412755 RepID=A0A0F8YB79_9ZZZZ